MEIKGIHFIKDSIITKKEQERLELIFLSSFSKGKKKNFYKL